MMRYAVLGTLLLCAVSFLQAANIHTESFANGTTGWSFSTNVGGNDWKLYDDEGLNGGNCLGMNRPHSVNFAVSPAITLEANKTYTLLYAGRSATNNARQIWFGWNTAASFTGATHIGTKDLPAQSGFADYMHTFTVPADGDYHLAIQSIGPNYGRVFIDDIRIEETFLPTANWTAPANGATFVENGTVTMTATGTDVDGSIARVDFYRDGVQVGSDDSAPFEYVWNNVPAGIYDLHAVVTDNHQHQATTTTQTITVTFADGTISGYVDYVFNNNDNAELIPTDPANPYWYFGDNWQLHYTGINGSDALFAFNTSPGDYAASPPLELKAGVNYRLDFLTRGSGTLTNQRIVEFTYHTTRALGGTLIDTIMTNNQESYDVPKRLDFTVPADDVYHLVIEVTQGNKVRFDNMRLRGDLNQAPWTDLDYPLHAPDVAAENSFYNFVGNSQDPDGTVSSMEFYGNGMMVAADNSAPFTGFWNVGAAGGNITVKAMGIDDAGASGSSFERTLQVVPNHYTAASYLGGGASDEVRGAVIQSDGTIVLAANVDQLPGGVTPTYLNGTTAADRGMLVRLNATGSQILSATIVATRLVNLDHDAAGNLYTTALDDGLIKTNADASAVLWTKDFAPKFAQRVDVTPNGTCAVLTSTTTDPDAQKQTSTTIHTYDASGLQLGSFGGPGTFNTDVCIEQSTQTVIVVGYTNYNTHDGDGNYFPVDVPRMRGYAYDGTVKYSAYNWSSDQTSPDWLNSAENNMADTRGARCEIGDDGKLYVVFEVDGGNHILRYDPFGNTTPVSIVGGDAFSEFYNTNTEPKVFVGRYDVATGAYQRGQQFVARLTSTKGNTVRPKNGDIAANSAGAVWVVGESAWGIPITTEHQPGAYIGGAFTLVLSPDFIQRQLVERLTRGKSHAVALGPNDVWISGGSTSNEMFLNNALQPSATGSKRGWFGLHDGTGISPAILPVEWLGFTVEIARERYGLLRWQTANEVNNDRFEVERSMDGSTWRRIGTVTPEADFDYEFLDETPLGTVTYYRLRQVDLDGSEDVSKVVVLRLDDLVSSGVFPNPIAPGGTLMLPDFDGPVSIDLLDAGGKHLRSYQNPGATLSLDGVPSGMYQLRFAAGGRVWQERLVVR